MFSIQELKRHIKIFTIMSRGRLFIMKRKVVSRDSLTGLLNLWCLQIDEDACCWDFQGVFSAANLILFRPFFPLSVRESARDVINNRCQALGSINICITCMFHVLN